MSRGSTHSDSPRRGPPLRDHSDFPLMILIPPALLRHFDSKEMSSRLKEVARLDHSKLSPVPGGGGILHLYSDSIREKTRALDLVLDELDRENEGREVSTFVPEDMVSPLIGTRGRQIAAMQELTKTNLRFERKNEDFTDRQVRVTGHLKDIKFAIEKLHAKVVERRVEMPEMGNNPVVKFAIPQTSASHLIGKGGTFTKTIQQKYGVELKVSRDENCDEKRELVATLLGRKNDCLEALNDVITKLEEAVFNSEFQKHSDKTVLLIKTKKSDSSFNAMVRDVKREAAVSLKVFEPYRDEFRVEISGELKDRQRACKFLLENAAGSTRESPVRKRPRSRSRSHSPPTTSMNVLVPKSLVGRLIGKGGENVKLLKSRSGCHINFQQTDLKTVMTGDGKEARSCTMTGSAVAVSLGVRCLWEQILKFEPMG